MADKKLRNAVLIEPTQGKPYTIPSDEPGEAPVSLTLVGAIRLFFRLAFSSESPPSMDDSKVSYDILTSMKGVEEDEHFILTDEQHKWLSKEFESRGPKVFNLQAYPIKYAISEATPVPKGKKKKDVDTDDE